MKGMEVQRWNKWSRIVVAAQFGIPGVLLVARWVSGNEVWYGLGWQMFSN